MISNEGNVLKQNTVHAVQYRLLPNMNLKDLLLNVDRKVLMLDDHQSFESGTSHLYLGFVFYDLSRSVSSNVLRYSKVG